MKQLIFLLALAPAQLAFAAGPLRHAVVLDERVTLEGQAAPVGPGAVEAALGEALLAKGFTVVDAAHTRALRKSVDPRALVGGAGLGPLTTEDTDVIVAGIVTGSLSRPLGLNVFGCSLNAQIRVIAVDTGEVVLATSTQIMERDFASEQALFAASKKLAATLADALAAKTGAGAERRIELYASTDQPVEVHVIDQLLRAIEGVDGVVSARVISTAKDEIRVEIRSKGADTRALALRISEAPQSGLTVWGYSDRVLRAKLRLSKALALRLVPIQFSTYPSKADGSASLLPRALAASLGADGVFDVDAGSTLPPAGERGRILEALKKLSLIHI